MRELTKEEHLELMAFLSDKAKQLYTHEVKEAIRAGREPKNVYQSIFSRQQCIADEKDGMIIYRVYTKGFLKFTREVLPEIMQRDPEALRKKDARDIIEELYWVSGYSAFHKTPNEYLQLISEETCIYVILKKGEVFDEKVLRIDLCRGVIPVDNDNKKYEFQGGLLHAAKHFRIDNSSAVDCIYDLEKLVYLSICAFEKIIAGDQIKYTICLPYDASYSIQFGFYKEKRTNVFYVNTIYPMNNCAIESYSVDGKFGLKNIKGGVIIPCKYDDIIFNEEANCFVCKRDGVFFFYFDFEEWLDTVYTGVIDLYSDTGELLIGGIDGYKFLPAHNVLFIHFGSQWEEDVWFKGKYKKRERYAKWTMLDSDMKSVPWKSVCLKGTIIKSLKLPLAPEIAALEYVNSDSFSYALNILVGLPNIYTFEDYRVLNGNQIYLFPDFLIFTKENYTVECDWAIPLEDNIAVYKSKNEWENIGIATNKFMLPANYSYISKPFKGWCLGVGRMHSIPYEGKETFGYCELINTQRIEVFHTILFKDLEYEKVEDLINRNILRILEIDEATSNTNSTPCITIPKELYEQGIINPVIKEKVRCGDSVRDLKKEKIFISSEELSRQRKEYLEYLCPHDIHVPDRTSPLVAFEGDGELYNEWLNS